MRICQNAEGVDAKRKVGNPCSKLNNALLFVEVQDLPGELLPSLYYRVVSTMVFNYSVA